MDRQRYISIMLDTINYVMPQYEVNKILKELKKNKIIGFNNEDNSEIIINNSTNMNEMLTEAFGKSDNVIKYIEESFIQKAYRYSIYYNCENFELNSNSTKFINIENFVNKYKNNEELNYINSIVYEDNEKIIFRFLTETRPFIRKIDRSIRAFYVNLWIYHKNLKILEYRFDSIGADGDDYFYEHRMDGQLASLSYNHEYTVKEFRSSNIIKYIVDNKKGEVQEISQSIGLKKNSAAKLKVGSNKIMPFIGDFEEMIEKYADLFNKNNETKELKNIFEDYINNIKRNAKYKSRLLSWYNRESKKDKSILDIQVMFSYRDKKYDLFNFHEPKKINGELMDFAIKYIVEVKECISRE